MFACKKAIFILFFLLQIGSVQAALPTHDSSGKKLPSLAPMLKRVNPAVVNISTYSTRQVVYNPLLNDPFFRYFFNLPDQQQLPQRRQQSAGSGVILDATAGIVITNYHVIRGADEVQVSLLDGRSFTAEIKGVDPEWDIAILKIEGKNLTEISLADSGQLEVGDFVIAIGNPFGLGQTVTTGVVSALGRAVLGINGYENFIQTDASINPGNSGGALVDLGGRLVGINTAIIAPAGGNVGIGFAIPANMAKASMEQIIEYGEIRRGQIGVKVQDITPDLRSAFNLEQGQQGVLVTNVNVGSPAEKAGVKPGDVVIKADGFSINSSVQYRGQIGMRAIGAEIELTVIRNGQNKEMIVEVGKPSPISVLSRKLRGLLDGARFESNPDGAGVDVAEIVPGSSAAYSGLLPGDVIVGANRRVVSDVDNLMVALSLNKKEALLQIYRNGGYFYLVIR